MTTTETRTIYVGHVCRFCDEPIEDGQQYHRDCRAKEWQRLRDIERALAEANGPRCPCCGTWHP